MIDIKFQLKAAELASDLKRFWELSGEKINHIEKHYDLSRGAPVYTVKGQYTTRGWTEWTQGFQFGSAILQYDATGDIHFLELGKQHTVSSMATHISHIGVHDH